MTTNTGRPGLLWARVEFDLRPDRNLSREQTDKCGDAFRRVVGGSGGTVHSVTFDGEGAVSIVLGLPPHVVMSKTVNAMKTVSARSVNGNGVWTRNYRAESTGDPNHESDQR